jgi:hypothetical protein
MYSRRRQTTFLGKKEEEGGNDTFSIFLQPLFSSAEISKTKVSKYSSA